MASASAVLDVVVENKEISSILRRNNDNDRSSICSGSLEESLIRSPTFGSFSTIQDMENLAELNVDENSDLCIKIDNPQKHVETLDTFITFRITTKVARIEYPENEYCVRRRYNDFIWLRQKLVEQHPFCIVPPLPGKHSLMGQLDRYSKEFILLRMTALNHFMFRIAQHPILSCSENLYFFLTAKHQDFAAHRRQRQFLDSNSRSILMTNSSQTSLKYHNVEFDKMKTYLSVFSEKLNSVEKISSRITKERNEFITELNSFHPIFTAWATSESELSNILQSIGHAFERMSSSQSSLVQNYHTIMGTPIKDLLSYVDVVQETLRKRESHQQACENAVEELNKRHNEKDKLVAISQSQDGGGFQLWKNKNCDEQLEKLGTRIPQLLKKVEANQDYLECANECLRSDLERWQTEKQECLRKILLDFVNKQIECEQAQLDAWEQVTNAISAANMNNIN